MEGPVSHTFKLLPEQYVEILVVGREKFGLPEDVASDFTVAFSSAGEHFDIVEVQRYDSVFPFLTKLAENMFLLFALSVFGATFLLMFAVAGVVHILLSQRPDLIVKHTSAKDIGQRIAIFEALPKDSPKRKEAIRMKSEMLKRIGKSS